MSKRKGTNDIAIMPFGSAFDDNKTREILHESGLFYCKGKNNVYNGVVLSKLNSDVLSVAILDEFGREIVCPWKVFYFGKDDVGKEIEIMLKNGQKKRFVYSVVNQRIERKLDIFEYCSTFF